MTKSGNRVMQPRKLLTMMPSFGHLSVPKTISEYSDGAIRRGTARPRWRRDVGSAGVRVNPCRCRDVCGWRYNTFGTQPAGCADAPRSGRSHDRGVRAGAIRLPFRHSHSAREISVRWVDRECPYDGWI